MKNQISTLEELELEQEKLKMTMELTRQEFARNLGTNRKQLKSFVLKNVALPVGAVGVGIAAVNKMTSNKDQKNSNASTSSNSDLWKTLLLLGANLFQGYFLKKQNEEIESIAEEQKQELNSNIKLRTVA